MLIYITLVFCLASLKTLTAAPAEVIVRPNVGAVFIKERDINVSPMVWHHTLALPYFMDFTLLHPAVSCSNEDEQGSDNNTICDLITDMEEHFYDLTAQIISEITSAQRSIKSMMDTKPHRSTPSRPKRAWFNILGTVAKKIMGVATEEDIKILQSHLQQLAIMIATEKKERIHDVQQLQSFEVRINKRVDTFRANLQNLDSVITDIYNNINDIRKYKQFAESLAKQIYKNTLQINKTRQFIAWAQRYQIHIHTLMQLHMHTDYC